MSAEAAPASPLKIRAFRALWIATIVSNVGTWMHDVGAGWLMTSLSPSPLLVALVQSATTLPMFLFALPGGALADIIDRRRLLIGAQLWALLTAAVLAATTLLGLTDPTVLLVLTFALATGAAVSAPAFQAIVPELVPASAVPQAVALNSLGINIARAIGPALGGLIIALSGPAAVFALNAVSVLGVAAVLWRWQRAPTLTRLPAEHFFGALRAGVRYARGAPALQTVLIRSIGFFLFSSALWALLPLVARRELGLGPGGYGSLLAFIGLGAVGAALVLPRLRSIMSPNRLTIGATLLFGIASAGLAFLRDFAVVSCLMVGAGAAWITMLSALNGAAQAAAPSWVRARALAISLLTFQGSMTVGATLWGTIASESSIGTALSIAAVGQVAAIAIAAWRPLTGARLDLAPSLHWPAPATAGEVAPDRGPVLITVEYRIDPARTDEFKAAMAKLRRIRKRDGALSWALYEDVAAPGLMVESFVVESWLEHLRQHERVTHADVSDQEMVRAFHTATEPPIVRHLIAP